MLNLLDLQQREANIAETRDSTQEAKQARQAAEDAGRQNVVVFIFTVVTVVFVS